MQWKLVISFLIPAGMFVCAVAFQPLRVSRSTPRFRRGKGITGAQSVAYGGWSFLSMCICIDCARVTNCAAYHFVETRHNQPHMTENPSFTPRDGSPTIHANIRMAQQDDVMDRVYKEHNAEQGAAAALAGETATAMDGEGQDDGALHGQKVYDLSYSTTIEYDVVACEDFVEDHGCW